jgi:hypothetical protein
MMPTGRKPLSLKTLRQMWVAFALSFLLIARVGSFATGVPVSRPDWRTGLLAMIAAWSAWSIYRLCSKLMARGASKLAEGNPDAAARTRSAAHVLGFASAESIVLWGLVAHLALHSPAGVSLGFYFSGAALLVFYWPKSSADPSAAA